MRNEFFYTLRFAMQPGRHEQDHFDRLLAFCNAARIDDVMFFINGEELNLGHLTREETKPWMEMIARGKALLQPLGFTISINPWPTLLHGDRGRTLREGQKFTRMVDPYGNEASAVACPLCPEWRSYIADIYACYAQIQPEILWVEDDFRLHNHRPLIWGGCFCERHMEEYSKQAGKSLGRSDFVEGVLKPGKPHPYRKIWLDTSRDAMVEAAQLIGDSVHRVSPGTKVGLMSSNPHVHCAEGRDWQGILSGLSAGNTMVNRPHLPAYTETTPQEYLQGMAACSMLTASMAPGSTLIYPELESFPHSRFSKSKTFTGFQLETSLALGAKGITLNIFDMMGNGIMPREGYQHVLSDEKEFLSAVQALGLGPGGREGVQVLASPLSSYTLHTSQGRSMEELYPQETFWARLLRVSGIANTYCVGEEPEGSIVAVSGQYFRNLTGDRLKKLFNGNFVMMDGEAAYTLCEMGHGGLAGMLSAVWHPMESGFQAYEQACCGRLYAGVEDARISAQSCTGDYLQITYSGAVTRLSNVLNSQGETVGAGMAAVGGNVLILPYGRFESIQGHLTPVRQAMLQAALEDMGDAYPKAAFVSGEPDISIDVFDLDAGKAALLTNCTLDAVREFSLCLPGAKTAGIMKMSLACARPVPAAVHRDGKFIVLEDGIGALETVVLLYHI